MKVKQLTEELNKCNPEDLVVFMGDKRNCLYSGIKSVESGYKFYEGEIYGDELYDEDDIDGIKDKLKDCVYLEADESI